MGIIGIGIGVSFQNVYKRVHGYDSFNRADNPSSLGNADTGQTWVVDAGPWGISENRAYTSSTSSIRAAVIDTGYSNCKITVSIPVMMESDLGTRFARLLFRYTDINNHFHVQANKANNVYALQKRIEGSATTIGSYSGTVSDGDKVSVELNGDKIKVYLNGNLIINVSDNFNVNATKHGLGSNNTNLPRYDDFIVEAI